MFDCTPRHLHTTIGCTPPNICANTYQRDAEKVETENICGFITCEKRVTSYISRDAVCNPGPGDYDSQLPPKHIKGGTSIRNRSLRFPKCNAATPPHEITPTDLYPLGARSHVLKKAGKVARGKRNLRELTVSPSTENATACFRCQVEIECKPAIDDLPCYDTGYRGPHFPQSPRFRHIYEDSPGPADYDPYKCYDKVNIADQPLQQMHIRQAKIRRYLDEITNNECKQGTPGVGEYAIKRDFEGCDSRNGSFARDKRFVLLKDSLLPGPGEYNTPSDALFSKRSFRTSKPGFLSTTPRFSDELKPSSPGPGSYNLEVKKRCFQWRPCFVENVGGFGSSAPRTFANDVVTGEIPAPNEYFPQETVHRFKLQPNAIFVSKSERMSCVQKSVGPGRYNVGKSFDFVTKKHDHRAEGKGAFLTSARRNQLPRDVRVEPRDLEIPAPGKYTLQFKKPRRGPTIPKASRFPKPPKPTPGPAAYSLSCPYLHTVNCATFNAFLGGKPRKYFRRANCVPKQKSPSFIRVQKLGLTEDWVC